MAAADWASVSGDFLQLPTGQVADWSLPPISTPVAVNSAMPAQLMTYIFIGAAAVALLALMPDSRGRR